jgi:hypothetical protein
VSLVVSVPKNGKRKDRQKKVLKGKFYKKIGKPTTWRQGVVQKDELQILGIRGYRRRAGVEKNGEFFCRRSRVQRGLQCHMWIDGRSKCTYKFSVLLFKP